MYEIVSFGPSPISFLVKQALATKVENPALQLHDFHWRDSDTNVGNLRAFFSNTIQINLHSESLTFFRKIYVLTLPY